MYACVLIIRDLYCTFHPALLWFTSLWMGEKQILYGHPDRSCLVHFGMVWVGWFFRSLYLCILNLCLQNYTFVSWYDRAVMLRSSNKKNQCNQIETGRTKKSGAFPFMGINVHCYWPGLPVQVRTWVRVTMGKSAAVPLRLCDFLTEDERLWSSIWIRAEMPDFNADFGSVLGTKLTGRHLREMRAMHVCVTPWR